MSKFKKGDRVEITGIHIDRYNEKVYLVEGVSRGEYYSLRSSDDVRTCIVHEDYLEPASAAPTKEKDSIHTLEIGQLVQVVREGQYYNTYHTIEEIDDYDNTYFLYGIKDDDFYEEDLVLVNEHPKTPEEIVEWLVTYCSTGQTVRLNDLDFSKYDCDVEASRWKVPGDLAMCHQIVKGDLYQYDQEFNFLFNQKTDYLQKLKEEECSDLYVKKRRFMTQEDIEKELGYAIHIITEDQRF